MDIVITGATSFIGIGILKKLLEEDDNRIWAVVRPNSINRNRIPRHKRIQIIELDMAQIDKLDLYIHEPVDVFYHLAWEGIRGLERDDAALQEKNYLSAMDAFYMSKKLNCHKFIGSGSQAEYGPMSGIITEEYPCNPNTEYGKAKLRVCQEIDAIAKKHQIEFIWGRIFSVYGIGDYMGSLIMTCVDKMLKGENIELTKCIQEWDYLYIDEAAEIFAKFGVMDCKSGIYNIASGKHQQLRDYVEIIKKATGSDSWLEYGKVPYTEKGMVSFIPDISKLKKEIHWESEITFEEGIKRILQGWKR